MCAANRTRTLHITHHITGTHVRACASPLRTTLHRSVLDLVLDLLPCQAFDNALAKCQRLVQAVVDCLPSITACGASFLYDFCPTSPPSCACMQVTQATRPSTFQDKAKTVFYLLACLSRPSVSTMLTQGTRPFALQHANSCFVHVKSFPTGHH